MPFDFGSGNPSTNQTSTQQNIGSQSSGGVTRIAGGSQATGRGQAASGDRNRQLSAYGNRGNVVQGNRNTILTAQTNKGDIAVSNTVNGVSGDDLNSILHNFEQSSNVAQQDFASIAHNALDLITPSSAGVPTPSPQPIQISPPTGFLDNLANNIGITTNELMLLLGAIAFVVSLYFIKHK